LSRKKKRPPDYELLTRAGNAAFWEDLYSYPPWQDTYFNNYGYSPVDDRVGDLAEKYQVQMYREAIKTVSPEEWESLLEVGCGNCGGLDYLLDNDHGKRLAGVDISETIIRKSRERIGPAVELRAAPAEDLPFDTGSFDLVLTIESSNFFSDAKRAFREIRRVLKPEGSLVVADFRLRPYVEDLFSILGASGFDVQQSRDITDNVVKACELDSERRTGFLTRYAERDKAGTYREYLGTADSKQFLLFKKKLYTYFLAVCRG
jgi:ubiquinone/menaquinone biosynthesis C-methylase UbiE